ncbi:MAG TPA: LuxR C-terminal-related transcriptional regulator [Ktedonobacteraceae bacterium]
MPRSSLYALLWSEEHQQYEVHLRGQLHQHFPPEESESFSRWLSEQTSFAFVGQAGWLSVIKEARSAGAGYWYAYRTQDRHTHKRYLGSTAKVTFARLEEAASGFTSTNVSKEKARSTADQQQKTFLSIKLVPPRLPHVLVDRPRLLCDLDAICTCPLTLISASAGSGKTTLLATWITETSQRLARTGQTAESERNVSELAVTWLSLDGMDNDPLLFWGACIAALQTCEPSIGQEALALLHTPEPPPLSTILTNLLNELREVRREVILVLDDYHVIEHQAISESMLFFLEHLPSNLHLVFATRADPELPLARWRVRGQLIEIRDRDLRFSREEAASFLRQAIGHPLTEEEIAILQRHTEGWIAGLQLAALSLSRREDVSIFVKDFGGSHRFVLDYVQQDILAGLPIALQHFLLQTSILTRMNAAVCQAVTSVSGEPASQEMLETLERANLFVVPLDEKRQWYRYHDLFREALRARLYAAHPELVPLLHTRAARWYESQGEWREAITHALTAPDYPLAASLIEQAAPVFWSSGETSVVQNWVLTLPDAVLRAHTRLALNAALRFLNSVHLSTETEHATMRAQVQRTITRMEGILRCQQALFLEEAEVALIKRRLRLLWALIEVRAYFRHGDKERLRLLTQELGALPPDDEVNWKLIPLTFSFWLALAEQQDSALLVERLRAARGWISEAGDPLATFRVMTWLARASIEAGQLHLAHREARSALALLDRIGGSTPVAGYLLASLFDISYTWNRLEEAADWLQRLQRFAQDWQQVELLAMGERAVARLALAQGNLDTAQEALRKAEALLAQEEFANNARWVGETRVQVWLANGNLAEASTWAAQTSFSLQNWDPLRKWEVLLLVRVLLAQQQYTSAVEMLERFREHLDQSADIEKTLEWMALSVVALHHAGKSAQAMPIAARMLAMTEQGGYLRLYLDAGEPMRQALSALLEAAGKEDSDAPQEEGSNIAATSVSRSYVSRLLAAFEQEEQKRAHRADTPLTGKPEIQPGPEAAEGRRQGVEPLSRQELRVLRLLVTGQTYAEMAEALVVSPNTIKSQVGSIYRKLNVRSRLEAYTAAQRLRLI